jgi:hypothetical protein
MAASKKRATRRKPAAQQARARGMVAPASKPPMSALPPMQAGFRRSAEDLVRERAGEQDEPEDAEIRDMMARIAAARNTQSWRPACTPCVHQNKLASLELSQKLAADGTAEGSPEWVEAMNTATLAGQQAFQEGKEIPGGALPPVRQADLMVSGTGVCVACFPAVPGQPPAAPGRSGSGLIVG